MSQILRSVVTHLFGVALLFVVCGVPAIRAADSKIDPAKLKVGDKVEFEFGSRFVPATVTKKLDGDRVEIKREDFPVPTPVPISWLRLPEKKSKPAAPRSADDPFATEEEKKVAGEMRTWTDKSGKFKVQAKLLKIDGDNLLLRREDDKEITVPLEKFQPADQKYVADVKSGKLTLAPDVAPDEKSDDDKNVTEKSPAGKVAKRTEVPLTKVDLDSAKLISVTPEKWTYQPDAEPPSKLKASRVPLEPIESRERPQNILFVPTEKKAYVVYSTIVHDTDCRVQICDLERNKMLAQGYFDSGFAPQDIAPDGSMLVARSQGFGSGKDHELRIYSREGDKAKPVAAWSPYPGAGEMQGDVTWVEWIDAKHVATTDDEGIFAVFEVPKVKPVYVVRGLPRSTPSFSGNRKYVALAVDGGLAILNPLTGEVAGLLETSTKGFTFHSPAFSPDGTMLALRQDGRLTVWDLSSQKMTRDFPLPSAGASSPLTWIDPAHVLSNGAVIDIERRIPVWVYTHMMGPVATRGGQLWYLASGLARDKTVLTAEPALMKKVQDPADKATADDLLVIKPGVEVAVDLPPGGPDAEKTKQAVVARLEQNGVKVVPQSKIRLVGTIGQGKTVSTAYRSIGPRQSRTPVAHSTTEQILTLSYQVDGNTIWKHEQLNRPPAILHMDKNETVDQALARSMKIDVASFGAIWIPSHIARVPEKLAKNTSPAP